MTMNSNRTFPAWQTFAYKYQGREQEVFEDLARNLFRKEMGIKTGIFQRVNHKGNETDVIERDGKLIGFQAKYFSHGIDSENIIHSMKMAKKGNPNQTHYYIYCNQSFGNPKPRKESKESDHTPEKTIEEEKIDNAAKALGLTLVWKLNKAILDEVNADDNIYDVFFGVSDLSTSMTYSCSNSMEALKMLYDLIISASDALDKCIIYVLNKGGINWYENIENRAEMFLSIYAINSFINQNRFFFSNDSYVEVCRYYELATNLRCSLDCLVQAITTADDPDRITDVYEITYGQDIHINAHFVRFMMDAFKQADKHPAYDDFADDYEQHEKQCEKILAMIESRRDIAI